MGPGIDRTYPASASKVRKSALAVGLLHDLGPGRQLVDDGALELLAWDAGRLKAELAELLLDVRHRGDRQDRLAELLPVANTRQLCRRGSRSCPWSCPSAGQRALHRGCRRSGELLRVLTRHLLHCSEPGRQTETLE